MGHLKRCPIKRPLQKGGEEEKPKRTMNNASRIVGKHIVHARLVRINRNKFYFYLPEV